MLLWQILPTSVTLFVEEEIKKSTLCMENMEKSLVWSDTEQSKSLQD